VFRYGSGLFSFHSGQLKGISDVGLELGKCHGTHTCLTALFWDHPGELVPERAQKCHGNACKLSGGGMA